MVYLTHYTEYPIYEPAEGGYYYTGRQAGSFYRLNSVNRQNVNLKNFKKNLKMKVLCFAKIMHICIVVILAKVNSGELKKFMVLIIADGIRMDN